MTDDDRRTCTACQHLIGGWCKQAKRAGIRLLASIEIGRALANLPQRCPAFKAKSS